VQNEQRVFEIHNSITVDVSNRRARYRQVIRSCDEVDQHNRIGEIQHGITIYVTVQQ